MKKFLLSFVLFVIVIAGFTSTNTINHPFKVYNYDQSFWDSAEAEGARAGKVTWCGNNNYSVISSSVETVPAAPFPNVYVAHVKYQDNPQ